MVSKIRMDNYSFWEGIEGIEADYTDTIWSPASIVDDENSEVEEPPVSVIEDIEKVAEGAEGNPNLFNGPLMRVNRINPENGVAQLDCQRTNYFSHVGTRERDRKDERADPLSVGSILEIGNYIALGKKSGTETGEGEYQLVGAGFVEPPEGEFEGTYDEIPVRNAVRELGEETGLAEADIDDIDLSTIVEAAEYQPMAAYNFETGLGVTELSEKWFNDSDGEFSEIMYVAKKKISDLLEDGYPEVLRARQGEGEPVMETDEWGGELRTHAVGALEHYINS